MAAVVKRIVTTFSGAAYDSTTKLIVEQAPQFGVDEVRVYDDAWLLTTPYYQLNRWIFDREPKHGFGWCAWKAYILLEEMKRIDTGDIVLYLDADTYPIADLSPLFELAYFEPIILFEAQGCSNARFTTRDCFAVMGLPYGDSIMESQHACGRFALFKKGSLFVQQFLMDWYVYMLNPRCQFNEGSTLLPDHLGFGRHSADQSVLSCLAIKYGIPLHREACQNGWPAQPNTGQPEDTYPQLFIQRFREGDPSDLSGSRYRNVQTKEG